MGKATTYKSSGVDIKKAGIFVDNIKSSIRATLNKNVLSQKGAFSSLYALDIKKYKQPVFVSSTDGVGTKLLIAQDLKIHNTVGVDLVAMNVNDLLCMGAKPLFFLDYIACGKLDPKVLTQVVGGIAKGCRQAGCALIGGETAEMPGMYKPTEYDLAGFAVGVAEKSRLIDGSRILPGDRLIGLASSGIHSNGYSLVRKVLSANQQKKLASKILMPTRIYVKEALGAISKFSIKGIAHITGGAFYEKLTRVLPKGLSFTVDRKAWPVPEIFKLIQSRGNVSQKEMYRTFNMGIGMVLVVPKSQATKLQKFMMRQGIKAFEIGEVVRAKSKISFVN